MNWLWKFLTRAGSILLALGVFFSLCLGWTMALYVLNPWSSAGPGEWPDRRPIAVTNGKSGKTRIILYRYLANEIEKDPTLVPWPATSEGTGQEGQAHTAWEAVGGKPWEYEVSWDDGDHRLESRYRLDGDKPVLVESRGRDPGVAFQGIFLAVLTLIVWKSVAWWHRRRMQYTQAKS